MYQVICGSIGRVYKCKCSSVETICGTAKAFHILNQMCILITETFKGRIQRWRQMPFPSESTADCVGASLRNT